VLSDVTLGGSPKHGIAQGMDRNITIGVRRQAPVMA
jgi:hypothetical protein